MGLSQLKPPVKMLFLFYNLHAKNPMQIYKIFI